MRKKAFVATLIVACFCIPKGAGQSNYELDVLYKYEAGISPIPIGFGADMNPPFAKPTNEIWGDYITCSVGFDNNSNILDWPGGSKDIKIFDPSNNTVYSFSPSTPEFNNIMNIKFGPENELYIVLSTTEIDRQKKLFKIVKYIKSGKEYVLDRSFNSSERNSPFRNLKISPDNYIYYSRGHQTNKNLKEYGVITPDGADGTQSSAICRTANGLEFYIVEELERTEDYVTFCKSFEIIDASSNQALIEYAGKRTSGIDLLNVTLNNKIVLCGRNFEKVKLNNDKYLINKKPYFIIIDLTTGATTEIATTECARDDYHYFAISQPSCNYLGEIFAVAVYYNNPGVITGDEKIIFYRWRPE